MRWLASLLTASVLAGCTSIPLGDPQPSRPVNHRLGQTVRVKSSGSYVADVTVTEVRHKLHLAQFADKPRRGRHYIAFRVTVKGVSGTTTVNPLYVVATSNAGDSFDPHLGAFSGELPSPDIGPGRVSRGLVGFIVPAGFHGTVEWDDEIGDALAYWRV